MRRRLAIATVTIVASIAARAHAEDAGVTLVVTGDAAPSFAASAKEGSTPRDAGDAAALLEGLPGVHVRRLGVEGAFSTVSIRGAASNQVAIVLAGVPLTGAADPSLDLSGLPLWPGTSVHAYRTFAPAALGGGYLGGLVSVDPIGAGTAERTEVYDAIGSYGALRTRVADVRTVGGDDARWTIATGLTAQRIDGGFRYYDPNISTDISRRNAGSAGVAGLVQARRDLDRWTILITALAHDRRDGVPGTFLVPTYATTLRRDRELIAVEARERDDDGRFVARGWARREGRRFDDPLGEEGFSVASSSRDVVEAAGVLLGRSVSLGKFSFDPRLDEEGEQLVGTRAGGDVAFRRLRIGAAIDATYRATDWLRFVAAARADLHRDVPSEGAAHVETLPVAHLGVEWDLFAGLSIAAHGGVLARPPSFLELLGDGGAFRPSPDLKSEHALAADLGFRFDHELGALHFAGELVGFASRTHDLIVTAPAGVGTFRAENVGDAFAGGVEATGAVILDRVRVAASETYLATEDLTSLAGSSGKSLPGRPKHDLTLDASVVVGPVTLRYGLDVIASTALNREETIVLPTRVLHGVGAKWAITKELTLLGEIDNLFDQRTASVLQDAAAGTYARYPVSDFLGYPTPGRRFTVAIRGSFDRQTP